MPNSQVLPKGTASAPSDFVVASAQELQLRVISATFDGTGAGTAFLPAITLISSNGAEIGTFPVDTSVAAGASADVSFFPRSVAPTSTAPASGLIGACAGMRFDVTTPVGPADYHVIYDTLVYDTSGGTMWAAGSPTVMTAPSDGLYLLICQFEVDTSTNAAIDCKVFSNGPPGTADAGMKTPGTGYNQVQVTTTTTLTAGQTVFSQLSYAGAALTQFGRFGVGNYRNWFSMTKLA